ncbi:MULTISPECIES: hypothetical protein [unclassified Pseudomonas]|uniref:hypothetical protein n=1 Tax=unclassified Pseudomonas TaxID=196821 RepID=UPI00257DC519|nr:MULTISPECIES: hypothetical protein [unclassified Pseudomonas]
MLFALNPGLPDDRFEIDPSGKNRSRSDIFKDFQQMRLQNALGLSVLYTIDPNAIIPGKIADNKDELSEGAPKQ